MCDNIASRMIPVAVNSHGQWRQKPAGGSVQKVIDDEEKFYVKFVNFGGQRECVFCQSSVKVTSTISVSRCVFEQQNRGGFVLLQKCQLSWQIAETSPWCR